MTEIFYDLTMDAEFAIPDVRNFYSGVGSEDPSCATVGNDIDDIFNLSMIQDHSPCALFNEIAVLKPENYSSSDEDDRKFIEHWDIKEPNLDTQLINSPVGYIKQEEMEELSFSSDSDSIDRLLVGPYSPVLNIATTMETPPVSPEEKPLLISGSPPSMNILVIDNTLPSRNLSPTQTNPGRKLVPATPLRSHGKPQKVPVLNGNSTVCTSVSMSKDPSKIVNGQQLASPAFSSSPKLLTEKSRNLLLPRAKSIPIPINLSANQLQAMKRQQRMIKNRESASLSRKKKKEYVSSLETQIDELIKENKTLKDENNDLKLKMSEYEHQSLGWQKPTRLIDKTKKVTAVFAVLFMISFNVASFRNFPSSTSKEISDSLILNFDESVNHRSRSLLWTGNDLTNSSENVSSDDFNEWNSVSNHKCPLFINQTESLRLDSELRKWIDAYPTDNATSTEHKLSNESKTGPWPLIFSSKKEKNLRKIPINREIFNSRNSENEIKMFDFNNNMFDVNEPLYQAMDRKQDTFYVVSFSGEHLLLPALEQNQTLRPKMSLVLPSVTSNDSYPASDIITMMQIDCTVLDTKVLYVKEKDIPARLKSPSVKNTHKSNASFAKQAVRRRLNSPYLPVADKKYLSMNHPGRN